MVKGEWKVIRSLHHLYPTVDNLSMKTWLLLTFNIADDEIGDPLQPHGSSLSGSVENIGITELFDADSRPTFILDLCSPVKEVEGRIKVIWSNKVRTKIWSV